MVIVGMGTDISYEQLESLASKPRDTLLLNNLMDKGWFPQKSLADSLCIGRASCCFFLLSYAGVSLCVILVRRVFCS